MELSLTIPSRYLSNVVGKIAKYNKKLQSHGQPGFELTTGDAYLKKVELDAGVVSLNVVDLTVTGEPFQQIGAYQLKGIILKSKDDDGTPDRYKAFGGFVFGPEHQTGDCSCAHCNTRRDRKALFLVAEPAGPTLQIGGDCVEIYLGVTPNKAISTIGLYEEAFDILRAMQDELMESEEGGLTRGGQLIYPIDDFLAASFTSIKRYGFVSRQRSEAEMIPATADEAIAILGNKKPLDPDDRQWATRTLQHWKTRFPFDEPQRLDDFEMNIKAIAHSSNISKKSAGIAAYMAQGYLRALEVERQREQAAHSVHVGQIGEKLQAVLRVHRRASFETQYGTNYLVMMSDADGNSFIWKTANPDGFNNGDILEVSCKIKEHGEYHDVKQTAISHAKLTGGRFDDFPVNEEDYQAGRIKVYLKTLAEQLWHDPKLAAKIGKEALIEAISECSPPVLPMLMECAIRGMKGISSPLAASQALTTITTLVGIGVSLPDDKTLLFVDSISAATPEQSVGQAIKQHAFLAEAIQKGVGVLNAPAKRSRKATLAM